MTKEPIIIDGVAVSKCEFFDECEVKLDWSKCLAHCSPYPEGACYDDCNEYPNCYYKQLKRKEQECEELKDEILHLRKEGNKSCAYCIDLIEKEKQLDQLKKEIKNRNEKIEELRFSVSDLTNRLCNLNAEKSFRIVEYKQALQEIKNFIYIEKAKVFVDMEDFWEQILQKCEVIKDETRN